MDGYAVRAADTAGATEDAPRPARGDRRRRRPGRRATGTVDPGDGVPDRDRRPDPARRRRGRPGRGHDATRHGRHARSARPRCHGPATGRVSRPRTGRAGAAIRARGSDLEEGATLLEPGRRLSAAGVALAAGAACRAAHRPPPPAWSPCWPPATRSGHPANRSVRPASRTRTDPACARSSPRPAATPLDLGIARDDLDDVLARLRRALDEGVDAIIVSGGVSVGPYDVVKTAIEAIGRIDLWRVAVQPGKPFAFGTAAPAGRAVRRASCSACRATRSRASSRSSCSSAPRSAALAGRRDLLRPVDRATLRRRRVARATAGGRSSA